MSLYKRKGSDIWWLEISGPDKRRIQRSTGTKDKEKAEELHDRLKAEVWRVKELGAKPRRTWQEAVVRWLNEKKDKRALKDDQSILRWLHPYMTGVHLHEIDRAKIEELKREKLATGVTPATVNRMLALVRGILSVALKDWEWIDTRPNIREMPEPEHRIRWITVEEAERLLDELPPHLAEMVRFSLATGLRDANVTKLRWGQIDLQQGHCWLHADQMKGKKALPVSLNEDAINCIRRQLGKHLEFVFTYKGKPVTRANNHAWKKALKRAGIENFRWHDLRHTWASWHVQNGTPLNVLKEMGGWSDYKMVLRYAHLSSKHLADYANNVAGKVPMMRVVKDDGKESAGKM